MGSVFEHDLSEESPEEIAALEDPQEEQGTHSVDGEVFPDPLYHLKLEYSSERLYATHTTQEFNPGDHVMVPTRYGKDLALVMGRVRVPIGIRAGDVVYIDRLANEADISQQKDLKEKENHAFDVFREKVAQHKLDMKLIATHYLMDEPKILFFFSAENRVDFRDLVKDLVSIFKMRIELRQIGVRDESRITGGLGVCGRPFCCHAVTDKLRPVSIRMAKDQGLSLNSLKISGQCGRLLCCLAYEHDWYCEAKKTLPNEGVRLRYEDVNFRVSEVNPLTGTIRLVGEDGRALEVSSEKMTRIDGKWQIQ